MSSHISEREVFYERRGSAEWFDKQEPHCGRDEDGTKCLHKGLLISAHCTVLYIGAVGFLNAIIAVCYWSAI